MIYSCFNCQARLRVPENINLEEQTSPIILRCPNCKVTTSLTLNIYREPPLERVPWPSRLNRVIGLIRNSFLKGMFAEEEREAKIGYLQGRITESLKKRAVTPFNFLILIYFALIGWGIHSLSATFSHSITVRLIASACGLLLAALFWVVYRQMLQGFLEGFLARNEKNLFETIASLNLIFYIFLLAQNLFAFLEHLGYRVSDNPVENRQLYFWFATLAWLFITYFLFFLIRHPAYVFVSLLSGYLFFLVDVAHFLGFGFVIPWVEGLPPFLYLAMPMYYFPLSVALIYLLVGPWLAQTMVQSVRYFRREFYTRNFRLWSRRITLSYFFIIPLLVYYAGPWWERLTWAYLLGTAFLFFTFWALGPSRRLAYKFAAVYAFYSLVNYNAMSVMMDPLSGLLFLMGILFMLKLPSMYFRIRANLEGEGYENDINEEFPYLKQFDYVLQSLLILYGAWVGLKYLQWDLVFFYSLGSYLLLSGAVLLYFNYYRLAHLPKMLPWFLIFGTAAAMLTHSGYLDYGIGAFAFSLVALVMAIVWKAFLTRPYLERLEALYPPAQKPLGENQAAASSSSPDREKQGQGDFPKLLGDSAPPKEFITDQ